MVNHKFIMNPIKPKVSTGTVLMSRISLTFFSLEKIINGMKLRIETSGSHKMKSGLKVIAQMGKKD